MRTEIADREGDTLIVDIIVDTVYLEVRDGFLTFHGGGPACDEYRIGPEPVPTPSPKSPAMWDLVMEDFQARDRFGTRKHGQRLAAHDGRDALKDAYQEALDLAVYLRKALYERDRK
jgi:hypothetical protein